MAYREPAVTVIQEFQNSQPDVAAFNLPAVAIGPAYQLVNGDLLGTYDATSRTYSYAGKMPGAKIDLEKPVVGEVFPITKKPLTLEMRNAEVLVRSASGTGVFEGLSFTDVSVDAFSKAVKGDIVIIEKKENVTILDTANDGSSLCEPGKTNRLIGNFSAVKVGDKVSITGGTYTRVGEYDVVAKPNDRLLVLSDVINNGGGDSDDVTYKVVGVRGDKNIGEYPILKKVSNNAIELQYPVLETEYVVSYKIKRKISVLNVENFNATQDGVALDSGLTFEGNPILSGKVYASYRALRNDLAGRVFEFEDISDIKSVFGVDQIHPANPVAFGLSVMKSNTTTRVYAVVLDGDAIDNELQSHQIALEILEKSDMYALIPMTQNPVIHQIYKAHVEGMSDPMVGKTRVAIINKRLTTEQEVVETSTTALDLINSRVIINTQVDGVVTSDALDVVKDSTPDQFINVQVGDSVVIGSEVFAVKAVTAGQLQLDRETIAGNSVSYYVVRKDGISADGKSLYDRNATFVTSGVVAGHKVVLENGVVARIISVVSDKQLALEQIPGIVVLQTGITYSVKRELTKSEQAATISGYSASFASRRVVNMWPDILSGAVGSSIQDLPGFYGSLCVGAMTSGLPTQQGFTNFTISGFIGCKHSSNYFTDRQLNDIADGGTMILAQDVEQTPLYIRHQLTTDRSSIKFQEFSMTKNVDFADKFIKKSYAHMIGKYNIYDGTLDELKTTAKSTIDTLKTKFKRPKIGGVIKSGVLHELRENPDKIDSVIMRFGLDFPIPLNDLTITVEV